MKPTLLLIALSAAACAAPVYRLEPVTDAVRWVQGAAVLADSSAGISATISYLGHTPDGITFDVRLVNGTGEVVRVEPSLIWYYTYTTEPDSTDSGVRGTRWALDPEEQILQLDRALQREEAARTTTVLLDATLDLASTDNGIERTNRLLERQETARRFDAGISDLATRRDAWSRFALRRTDLDPDASVDGILHVPVAPDARYLRLYLPVGDATLRFDFRQTKTSSWR